MRIFFLLIFISIIFTRPLFAQEAPLPVVVINQIRGDEACCLPGNQTLFEKIHQTEHLKKLAISWALRFDVLINETEVAPYKELPKEQVGLLLEITPELASASGVVYKSRSDGSDWYQARNVFLIGYTQEERKKLIDTAVAKFKQLFNANPTFSVSWMIDSWSLDYLRSNYGVRIHELTKEQFETDSYTLYGGIFNMPYIAAKTYPLVAGDSGTLILRQTVSDIDQNYGSYKAYFTSQPNDYLSNWQKQDFDYFIGLMESMIAQAKESKFALLGLENSPDFIQFHDEFIKQLTFVAEKQLSNTVAIVSPQQYADTYQADYSKTGRFLKSQDFPKSGAFWYFGRNYRARIETNNGNLQLTDFRIIPASLSDPYSAGSASVSRAYWVVPYLLDSSQQFTTVGDSKEFAGHSVRQDAGVARFGIQLAEGIPNEIIQDGDKVTFKKEGQEVLRLTQEAIIISAPESKFRFAEPINETLEALVSSTSDQYISFNRHPRFFLSPKNKLELAMGWENPKIDQVVMATLRKNGASWQLVPNTALSQEQLDSLSNIFQPDKSNLPFDSKESTFYWHNTRAIAGRNPIRLYIDPRNTLGRSVAVGSFSVESDNQDLVLTLPKDISSLNESFFLDITSNQKGHGMIKLSQDNTILSESQQVIFYPDCQKEILACLKSTENVKGYVEILIGELLESYKTKLEKFGEYIKNEALKQLDKVLSRKADNTELNRPL